MAEPLLDPRNPDSPYHPQEPIERPPARPPEKSPPNVPGMLLLAVFILALVAGGFVFAFGGFGRNAPAGKAAPGVTFSQPDEAKPTGPNALGSGGGQH